MRRSAVGSVVSGRAGLISGFSASPSASRVEPAAHRRHQPSRAVSDSALPRRACWALAAAQLFVHRPSTLLPYSERLPEGHTRWFMSEAEQRSDRRVVFERPIEARLMAIDGTWQRACKIHDVSEFGAKLVIDGAVRGIGQKEFFLVLSPIGLAYRHCELSWVNGEFVGVQFINRGRVSKRARRGETLVK